MKPNFRVGKLISQQCVLLSWHKNVQKGSIHSITKYVLSTYCEYIFCEALRIWKQSMEQTISSHLYVLF